MQDNQVAAHLRSRVIRKEVVRQAGYAHQIGMVHHILAYGRVGRGIQYPLRGDERHDSAFTHRVKAFQEKVIVYRPCRRVPCRILAARKFRVEHRHIAKRYIGDSQIKMVHERLFYLLEALYPYFLSGMQVLQYLARHQVFLKSHDVRVRSVLQHGVHECTDTCRRLQHPVGTDAVFMQHVRDGPSYLRRGIEGGQHGLLHGIHIPFVLRLVFCVLPQQPVQFHGRGKQFEVGLRPVDGIRQFPCRVEYVLQSPETAITF